MYKSQEHNVHTFLSLAEFAEFSLKQSYLGEMSYMNSEKMQAVPGELATPGAKFKIPGDKVLFRVLPILL